MYAYYNVLVPYFGLSKGDAMKEVGHKFPKKQTKATREATHIPDYSAGKAKKDKNKFKGTPNVILSYAHIHDKYFFKLRL